MVRDGKVEAGSYIYQSLQRINIFLLLYDCGWVFVLVFLCCLGLSLSLGLGLGRSESGSVSVWVCVGLSLSLGRSESVMSMCDRGGGWTESKAIGSFPGATIFKRMAHRDQ